MFSATGGINSVSGGAEFLRGRADPCNQWQAGGAVGPIGQESGSFQEERGRGSTISQDVGKQEVRGSGGLGLRGVTLMPGEQCGQAHPIDGQHSCSDEHLEALAP